MNTQPCVYIVDDDYAVRDALGLVMETAGLACQTFESAEHFLVLLHETKMSELNMTEQAFCNRLNSLTRRELEILPLVVAGHSNKEIARHIGISYRTVEIHRARILTKTGATNLLELARLCEACKLPPVPKPKYS